MKRFPLGLPLLAALLAGLVSPATASAAGSPGALSQANAPILYNHSGALFRVDPATGAVTKLTPQTADVFRIEGSWSPHGTRIVYTRASDPAVWNQDVYLKEQLYTIAAYGGPAFLLTRGPDRYQHPAWGPGPVIALVDATTNCLSAIRYDGQGLRPLFCPPFVGNQNVEWATPQWSRDGKSIFIQAGQFVVVGLDIAWHSSIYRVDASRGVASLLFKQTSDQPQNLAISPDGTHGIYPQSDIGTSMALVDFATGKTTSVVVGTGGAYYGIRYSPDGSRVAFTHDILVINPDGNYRAYNQTYVMRADGTQPRLITAVGNDLSNQQTRTYESVAGWSGDGSHLLLNRDCEHVEHGEYVSYLSIRTVDVATHAVKAFPGVKGSAGDGAWFQH
jgi:Tol biopolymer transport system component